MNHKNTIFGRRYTHTDVVRGQVRPSRRFQSTCLASFVTHSRSHPSLPACFRRSLSFSTPPYPFPTSAPTATCLRPLLTPFSSALLFLFDNRNDLLRFRVSRVRACVRACVCVCFLARKGAYLRGAGGDSLGIVARARGLVCATEKREEKEGRNTRCPPPRREEASRHRSRIRNRPFSLSLSLSHSFPLDKEASMNWSGVLDNLIKGRLPSLATAGPSHPLCDSLAPFCHP